MALYELKKTGGYEVESLLTTVTQGYDRISMHGVRNTLLERQAGMLGIPLEKIWISKDADNRQYEIKMESVLGAYRKKGVSAVAFGDIFLEDLRLWRCSQLSRVGLEGIFPLWKKDTFEISARFIELGFKAVVSCVDSKFLDKSFAGRPYDKSFISDLPRNVDPCGENGEFHSFVYAGPIFDKEIKYVKGEVVLRDRRFYYCDLVDMN